MKEYKIKIEKTARYFTSGNLDANLKSIWFVIHGYGQLAKYFLLKFNYLNNGSTFIVAPEALNKFYIHGFSGKVGATWMTGEDRESEIFNNTKYLHDVFNEITKGINLQNIKFNILGFSQGTKTAARWILNSDIKIENLILWGGSLPPDIDFNFYRQRLDSFNLHLVIGKNDEFISAKQVTEEIKNLNSKNIKFTLYKYNGKHNIPDEVLKTFYNKKIMMKI